MLLTEQHIRLVRTLATQCEGPLNSEDTNLIFLPPLDISIDGVLQEESYDSQPQPPPAPARKHAIYDWGLQQWLWPSVRRQPDILLQAPCETRVKTRFLAE